MSLAGRRALVTGAASGIGLEVARRLAAAEASVTLLDRDAAGLARAAASLTAAPGTVHSFPTDVRDEAQVTDAVQRAAHEMAGLDTVVCAAGVDLERSTEETDLASWNEVLAVNLTGAFLVLRAAAPRLRAAGAATVVTVSSGAGLRPIAGRPAYCASKAGLIMLSKALALELAPHGVRVNAVCPGAVDTPLLQGSLHARGDRAEALRSVAARYPLGRVATIDEVAAAILFLTDHASSFVTGVALAVDGGRTLH